MKKLIIVLSCIMLSGCVSDYVNRSMLCDVHRTENSAVVSKMSDGALVQDYPEKGYFVYQITGVSSVTQSPNLVNGVGYFDGIKYTATSNSYNMVNKKTGNGLFLTNCRKAL